MWERRKRKRRRDERRKSGRRSKNLTNDHPTMIYRTLYKSVNSISEDTRMEEEPGLTK